MFTKTVEDAILQENTDFFDSEFQTSDKLKSATHGYAGYSLLHYAARYSTEKMVKYFLDKGFPLDSRTFYNQTALHVAVIYCRCDVVKLLLEQGSPVDARDTLGRTALNYAMEMGKMRQMKSGTYKYPRRSSPGVPPNASAPPRNVYCCNEERSEAHFWSIDNRHIISHLLHHGADVNAVSEENDTPLFQAIARGVESLVRLLTERGANINHCKKGYNALHHAAQMCNNRNVVELLLDAGIDVNSLTASGKRTALHLAAASARSIEIVNLLIERGANIHAEDDEGETPILMAVGAKVNFEYRGLFGDAINNLELGEMRVLVGRATMSEPALAFNDSQTLECRTYIIRSLLISRAEVNRGSLTGESAFHRALSTGHEYIIELFLKLGADVNVKSKSGFSALHIAVRCASEKVVKMLLDKGAQIDDKIPEIGVTPLHFAVQLYKEPHIKLLIARGADINATDAVDRTPLHYIAITLWRPPQRRPCSSHKIVGILLDNGADPFARTIENKTPLDCAVAKQNDEVYETLLRHLAYLEAKGDPKALAVAMRGIENINWLMKVHENYQDELVKMKEEKICANISYFDTITLNLTRWVQNDEFVKAFKNNQMIKMFYYYEKVSKKFNDALNKRMAIEYLASLFSDVGLPIPICEMIVKYFEPEDIEKFVRSCEEAEL